MRGEGGGGSGSGRGGGGRGGGGGGKQTPTKSGNSVISFSVSFPHPHTTTLHFSPSFNSPRGTVCLFIYLFDLRPLGSCEAYGLAASPRLVQQESIPSPTSSLCTAT